MRAICEEGAPNIAVDKKLTAEDPFILSMYAKGMTAGDIQAHIRDVYGLEVPDTTVSFRGKGRCRHSFFGIVP